MLVLADLKDRANFNSLLKILAILAIKLKGGKIKPLKLDIGDSNKTKAGAFLKKYGGDLKTFNTLYNNILLKSSDVLPYVGPFVTDLRKVINKNRLKHDLDVLSTDSKSVMEPLLTLLGNPDSDNALSNLNRRIGLLKEPEISTKFNQVYMELASHLQQEQDQTVPNKKGRVRSGEVETSTNTIDNVSLQIAQTIEAITKKKGSVTVDVDSKTRAQETPEGKALLDKLTKLRKQLTDYKLNLIRQIVGNTPDKLVTTEDLTSALFAQGIRKFSLPPAFQKSDVVYVNLDGQYCDSEGRVAVRQGWQPDAEIRVNPSYSHDTPKKNWLYMIVTNGGATKNYVQTQARVSQNRADRFEKVNTTLESDIKEVKAKWRRSMLGKPDDQTTVFANIAEFVYQTTSRIGAKEGETKGSRTYGASNFLVRHVDLKDATDTRLKIAYPVKSGKNEVFVLAATSQALGGSEDIRWVKALIKFIREKCKGKKPDDLVFTISGARASSTHFNNYLNQIDLPFTAKTFRTMRGTELAIEALDQARQEFMRMKKDAGNKVIPAKTVNELFRAAMNNVGELLGHIRRNKSGEEETTANTAIKSYVDPKVMLQFYRDINYAPLSNVVQSARAAGIEV